MDTEESEPTLIAYDASVSPKILSRTLDETSFWRDAKWAPDGASVLAIGEDRSLSIFALPPDLMKADFEPAPLTLFRSTPSASSLLGAEWFPSASSQASETYCYVRSTRDAPVHLIDGTTGRVRASYPIIDHTERFVGPHSMTFAADGSRLYCGHENAIELFDVARPGEAGTRIATCPTRRSKDGQRGLMTSMSVSAHDPSQMVAGSYSSTVGLYDLDAERLMQVWAVPGGGVTQVAFHPASPHTVVIASRLSSEVQLFDTRNTTEAYGVLDRGPSRTNQRMRFTLDYAGRYLAAGATDGYVRIFSFDTDGAEPMVTTRAAKSTVGAAALHPYLPLLLTVTGSRSFADPGASDSDDSGEEEAGTLSLWHLASSSNTT